MTRRLLAKFFTRQYSGSLHEILGIPPWTDQLFAQQLNLDVGSMGHKDYCRELELGKYLILKDANNVSTQGEIGRVFCFSR